MWHEWETGDLNAGFLLGKSGGKKQLGRPWCRWEDFKELI